jgi:hypothetical protein
MGCELSGWFIMIRSLVIWQERNHCRFLSGNDTPNNPLEWTGLQSHSDQLPPQSSLPAAQGQRSKDRETLPGRS